MTTTRLRAAAALAFAFVAASCGGDGGGGPSFPDSISTADAQDFASGIQDYSTAVAQGLNFGGPSIQLAAPAMYARLMARPEMAQAAAARSGLLAPDFSLMTDLRGFARTKGPRFSVAEGCTYSSHGLDDFPDGTPIDLNGNGVPDDAGIRVECQFTDSTSNPDTVSVSYLLEEVAVKEIAGSLWGEQVHERIHARNSNSVGQFEEEEIVADGKTDIRSGSALDQANLSVSFSAKSDSITHTQTVGEGYNNSFDPTGTITLGNDLPDGALTISGHQYYTDTDATNASFGIQTTTPLAYSAACALANTNPPFTAGVLRGLLNNNANSASFEITFTGCGTATITTDGTFASPIAAR